MTILAKLNLPANGHQLNLPLILPLNLPLILPLKVQLQQLEFHSLKVVVGVEFHSLKVVGEEFHSLKEVVEEVAPHNPEEELLKPP